MCHAGCWVLMRSTADTSVLQLLKGNLSLSSLSSCDSLPGGFVPPAAFTTDKPSMALGGRICQDGVTAVVDLNIFEC